MSMRSYKVLSAVIVAAVMLAVPLAAVLDSSDATVSEKSSAVYFDSKEGLSYSELNKFIDCDISDDFLTTILKATADFNFNANGFSISDIKTSDYHVEGGIARLINDSRYESDQFSIIEMKIEFKLTAKHNDSELFARTFSGDAAYGFSSHVSVKQNDTITFSGTLRTECSRVTDNDADFNDSRYVIQKMNFDEAERTELVLDAVYRSTSGMEQTFSFKSSLTCYERCHTCFDFDSNEIKSLSIGDVVVADKVIDNSGKGKVTMEYEGKEYSSETMNSSYLTVYSGYGDDMKYSGKETCTISNSILMTEEQYKALYEEVKLKELFNNFTGTNQELMEQVDSIGSMTIDDFDKVEQRTDSQISDIRGDSGKDTSGQISNALIAVLIAVIIVLIAALVLAKRRKNRW